MQIWFESTTGYSPAEIDVEAVIYEDTNVCEILAVRMLGSTADISAALSQAQIDALEREARAEAKRVDADARTDAAILRWEGDADYQGAWA